MPDSRNHQTQIQLKTDLSLAQLKDEIVSLEQALNQLIQGKKMSREYSTKTSTIEKKLQQVPIAIVGMASIFPKARNLQEYWTNIIQEIDCISDVPSSRWNVEDYYDPNPKAPDKTYCKRGGFIPDVDFNPLEFGLPPNILEVTDISQLLSLVVAKEAMEDAGYSETRQFNRERTGVILGVALARQLNVPLFSRLQYPVWEKVLKSSGLSDEDTQKIVEKMKLAYVKWEENAFPGMLGNIVAGRIANRLDLGGMNCVVDAACASSLGALKMAISELTEHRSDMMLTGGVDTDNSIFAYLCFSKTPAVSKSENVKPFDADSDGMMLGEGIGMMVLKRLEDAERDNDRIYAVIKGIGTSSDGRYKSIYAPRPEGQVKALRRAYEDAGFSPSSVSLIEAHGTGTMAGDPAEFTALKEAFSEDNPNQHKIALGSVKSQIGHTKAAAGAASLIKTALALHHKVLPCTINVTKPNPKLNIENSPFYLNTETRPWIRAEGEAPRRAGVSSFGFGGTNYHIVLEEYESEHNRAYRLHNTPQSVLLFAPTSEQLLVRCADILQKLQSDAGDRHYRELVDASKNLEISVTDARVGFVADSLTQACNLLQISVDWLKNKAQAEAWNHPQGIYYRQTGLDLKGKVVALFSGQGSQYLEMGRELAINFPCLRQIYGYIDRLLRKDGLKSLSETVFPPPEFDPEKKNRRVEALQRTEYAQPAIGALSAGLYKILQQAGFKPDFVAGHSFGELTALWAAEVLSDEDYFFLVKARGQAMATPDDPNFDAGAMLAVKEELSKVEAVVKDFPQVAIANLNSNRQVVLAGPTAEITKVRQALQERGYSAVLLPVSAAFHTPLIEHAQKAFARASEAVTFKTPKVPVYTNVSGNLYPTEPQAIQEILETHLSKSVLFKQEIEKIYADGGYCFVEFGPRNILSNLVKDILHNKPHVAVALNASRQKDSDRQLREAVVQLRVVGLPLQNLDPYQVEYKVPEAPKGKVLSVRLNSSNYVSEKTKADFEKALQDGYQVQLPAIPAQVGLVERDKTQLLPALVQSAGERNGHTVKSSTNGSHMSTLNNSLSSGSQRNGHGVTSSLNGNGNGHAVTSSANGNGNGHAVTSSANGNGNGHAVTSSANGSETIAHNPNSANKASHFDQSTSRLSTLDITKTQLAPVPAQSTLESKMQSAPEIPRNHQRILESLEYTLTQFNQHQGETLQVHGQYLNHQMEYAKTFFQLMQQQNSLFANDKSAHQLPEAKSIILDSLERSMMQFHNHEAETLRIHEQYLSHQVEYTKHFFQLIQQEYSQLITGDVAPQLIVAAPNTRDRESPAASSTTNVVAKQDNSVLSTTPIAIPTSSAVSNTKPGVQNGSNSAEKSVAFTTETEPVPQNNSKPVEESVALTTEAEPAILETPAPSTSIDVADLSQALLAIVSDKTGYPTEMLELGMDMEADLGIDSIKRVEILGAIQELYPDLPKANPEELAELRTLGQIVDYLHSNASGVTPVQLTPLQGVEVTSPQVTTVDATPDPTLSNGAKPVEESVALKTEAEPAILETPAPSTSIDVADLSQALLAIVSDKTGYPTEMLELGMDMEADLGIDSIKRVEILGAIQELYPDLPKANPEELAELRTLGQIINYLHSNASGVALPTSAEIAVAPVLTTTVLTNSSPVSSNGSKVIQETLAVSTATEPISHNDSKAGEETLAVSTPSEPVITPTFAPSLSIDITDLSQSLLAIVSDKTGYPAQMLELDMDMEADLGIDSIKRVEILGAVQELYPDLPKANPEELTELRTLGQIVEYLQQQAVTEKKTLQDEFYSQQPELKHNIQRSLVRLKVLPEPDFLDFTLPDKHIGLLTDNGSFTTPKLAKALKERGWKVVVLSFPQSLIANPLPLPEGISRVLLDNLSEEHLKQQLAAITANYGPIAAFIHLNPSNHDEHSDKVRFLEVEKALLKHVFFIAKHLKKSLNEAARQGRSCFLTVARLDGGFGLGRKTNFGVISAGLFGLTKSVNLEWESVFCRALDLSPDLDAEQSTQSIIAELHDPNRLIVEVGRSSQERVTLVCEKPTVTQRVNHTQSQIPPTSVFLVSGGAKGITAQCVIKLAKRYQCRFILLGRSSIAESEPTWASSCSSESELKKRIMEELLAKGEKPTPAMVQKQFKAIVSKREVEKTLSAIAQAGGQAEYISVDVTDTSALQEKLAAAVQRLGPVTGIIHGAGNIADKLIEKKSEQDFETVYAAKVKGLENLLGCVNAAQLDYLVLFSSVVGFYGNVGQVDYAIANEILSKSAHLVKHHHPNCHVVAINWGPWEEGGMVTPEFKKVAEKQNVELIPLEIGTQLLLDELAPANHDIVQVVVGSPMLWPPAQVSNFELQTFRTHRKLTSEANPFLYDHEIGGYPVLPATCALAWIFNTCEQLYPGYKLVRCTNYRILKGIPFDETLASEYILELKEIAKTEDNEIEFDAKVFSVTSAGKLRYHFSAQPKIRQQLPPAPTYNSLNLTPDQAMPGSCETFYQNGDVSLFHGPAFQGVEKVLNVSPEKLTVQCVVQSIGEKQQGQFPLQIFNPRIADVQLHASWLWLQHFYQSGGLPAKVERIEQYAAIPCGEPFYVSLEVKSKTESSLVADIIAHNREGQIYLCLYGAHATIFTLPFNFRGK